MARKLDLPVKKIQTFLDAAVPWLRKCPDFKQGLELRLLAIEAGKLHISVGGTAYYIEATIRHPDVSNLAEPIYLDLEYMTRYTFQEDSMQITIPEAKEKEGRIQFRAPSVSFKIPSRTGEKWKANQQALKETQDIPGFALTGEFLKQHYNRLMLPNSFGDGVPRAFQVQTTTDPNQIMVYSNDDFGAFCHTFPATSLFPIRSAQSIKILYDFLLPFRAIDRSEDVELLELRQDQNQVYGSVEFTDSFFDRFCWIQPIHTKPIENIPQNLVQQRQGIDWSIALDTKEFIRNIDRVTSFYQDANYRENPISLAVVGDQYSLSTTLTNSDMKVDGKTLEALDKPVRARLQAGALKDYISCLQSGEKSYLELLRSSAVFHQTGPAAQLIYWMPIQDR